MLTIKKKLLKIHLILTKIDKWKLIFLAVLVNYFNTLFFSFISNVFFGEKLSKGFIPFNSLSKEFFLAIIIAPLFETFLFQYGIIESIKHKYKPFTYCLVSAFCFALVHAYNVFYFLFGFFAGLLLAYVYYLGSLTKKGIITTILVHLIYNMIGVILKHI